MTRVLHIFPDSVLERDQAHLGSTKDIRGRTQYFSERGMTVDECAHERSANGMRKAVASVGDNAYDVIMVEFPLSGRAMGRLRRRWPTALLLTRSANAELLHRWDWIRAMGPSTASAKLAVRAALNTWAEVRAARESDAVLSISQWEAENYWPRLTRRDKIHWLPYYVPDAYLPELLVGDAVKNRICVCLTSTKSNPLIEDSVRGFERGVASVGDRCGWRFVVTGEVQAGTASPRIENSGRLASPGELLRSSLLVALLSDLGFGFKTKLLDAIVAGNRVVVTPGLYARVPTILHPWTLTLDPTDPDAFSSALRAADEPLPAGDPNQELRELHHEVLDRLILEHCGAQRGGPSGRTT